MTLNNIKLSPQLLADLYPDVLIEMHATGMPDIIVNEQKSSPPYIGMNQKHILIIVSNDTNVIQEQELSFLNNVLTACKLSLAEVAIKHWSGIEKKSNQITEKLESKIILLFNIEPVSFGLPVNFPPFQIQPHNQITYLYAPPLLEIKNNIDLKKRLWTCLRTLFNV
ncbi:MAG TPA: hypothetical protein VNA26_06810 [Chitinophagaceae bacterium]|nr:hypothetical protein [Chitinophagaceae bacterium]